MSTHEKLLPCPFCGGEAEIWRASADPKRPAWVGCMGRCAVLVSREYETTEEAIAAWNRRTPPAAVPDGWVRLLQSTKLLYQNAEGCAANHHEVDFKAFGLPGWLADCKRDIENAEASLAMTPAQAPVAWADFADNGNIRLWTSEQRRAQLETDAGRKMHPLYASPAPTVKHVEGLKAAIRAAKLALFLIRKRGVVPNSSWESGFNRDLEIAENALSSVPAVPSGWQPIETAPKDGTKIDLWCVNHLHHANSGQRVVNVEWGIVRDWIGNEREDWCHGLGENWEPTHWQPLPAAPTEAPNE